MADVLEEQRARIEYLEERIRVLEEALSPVTVRVPIEWRLTATETAIFAHLTTREMATRESIYTVLYSHLPPGSAPEPKTVDVLVCKLRKKVTKFGVLIGTVWGQGYALADRTSYAAGARI